MEFDFGLGLPPVGGEFVQTAVVFTALGGAHVGELTYVPLDEYRDEAWLRWYATEYLPAEANARLMTRTVAIGPWRPA